MLFYLDPDGDRFHIMGDKINEEYFAPGAEAFNYNNVVSFAIISTSFIVCVKFVTHAEGLNINYWL